jgi:hypothetical protein
LPHIRAPDGGIRGKTGERRGGVLHPSCCTKIRLDLDAKMAWTAGAVIRRFDRRSPLRRFGIPSIMRPAIEGWASRSLSLSCRASNPALPSADLRLFGEPGLDQRLIRNVALVGGYLEAFRSETGRRNEI